MVSRWPGSAHDSTIFRNSHVFRRLINGDFENCVLVADSAYSPEHFICKPLNNPQAPNERIYQDCQIKARNVVERVNGQIKREFPIIKYGMNFKKKETAQDVVVCCAILHNMRKMVEPNVCDYTREEIQRQLAIQQDFQVARMGRNALRIQDFLVNQFFNR